MSDPAAEPEVHLWGDAEWRLLLDSVVAPEQVPRALTYIETRQSASKPVKVSASDGRVYFVKGGHAGRQIVNDQVVGILGAAIGAPTAAAMHVEITSELVDAEPELGKTFPATNRFLPGVWHGSLVIENVSPDREGIAHFDVLENRDRFALLAILYGWISGSDHQFLYANQPPRLVYACDHGHFFPRGPDWNGTTLSSAPAAVPDSKIVVDCSLTSDELKRAAKRLEEIDAAAVIGDAVRAVAAHWGVTEAEKLLLASYLGRRRKQILDAVALLN
jgi:hypothetical protein